MKPTALALLLAALVLALLAWVLWPRPEQASPTAGPEASAQGPAVSEPRSPVPESAGSAPSEHHVAGPPTEALGDDAGRRLPAGPLRVLVVNTERAESDTRIVEKLAERLRAVVDIDIEIRHLSHVGADTVDKLNCDAVVLSGQRTPWWEYTESELAGAYALLRGARVPVLGICGGHQLLAKAFGGEVGLIRRLRQGEGYDGCERERGWLPIRLGEDPLFADLGEEAILWENHCEEVKALPADFVRIASNLGGAIQGMRHKTRLIYGVQFHPEVSDRSHPAGATIIKSFFEMADEAWRAGGDGT